MIPEKKKPFRSATHTIGPGRLPAVHRKGIAKRGQHVAHKLLARDIRYGSVARSRPWPVMVRVGSADPRQHTAVPFGQLPRQRNHAAAGVASTTARTGVRIASIGQIRRPRRTSARGDGFVWAPGCGA